MKLQYINIKQNFFALRSLFFLMLFLLSFIVCCSPEEEYPQYNPPSDHTKSKDGVMHKNGLSDPRDGWESNLIHPSGECSFLPKTK